MRFRHSAGFGKRIEFWIIGQMLKEGLDVYVPLVDDNAIDAVVRRHDGSSVEVQIKARSRDVAAGDAALFAAIPHDEIRNNYWFVFYSERLQTTWIMTSTEFIAESVQNKTGKNAGLRSIWFNGKRKNKETGDYDEHIYPRFQRWVLLAVFTLVSSAPYVRSKRKSRRPQPLTRHRHREMTCTCRIAHRVTVHMRKVMDRLPVH